MSVDIVGYVDKLAGSTPGAENMLRLDKIIRKTGSGRSKLFQTICIFKDHSPTHHKQSSRIARLIPLLPPPHYATAPRALTDMDYLARDQIRNSAALCTLPHPRLALPPAPSPGCQEVKDSARMGGGGGGSGADGFSISAGGWGCCRGGAVTEDLSGELLVAACRSFSQHISIRERRYRS